MLRTQGKNSTFWGLNPIRIVILSFVCPTDIWSMYHPIYNQFFNSVARWTISVFRGRGRMMFRNPFLRLFYGMFFFVDNISECITVVQFLFPNPFWEIGAFACQAGSAFPWFLALAEMIKFRKPTWWPYNRRKTARWRRVSMLLLPAPGNSSWTGSEHDPRGPTQLVPPQLSA